VAHTQNCFNVQTDAHNFKGLVTWVIGIKHGQHSNQLPHDFARRYCGGAFGMMEYWLRYDGCTSCQWALGRKREKLCSQLIWIMFQFEQKMQFTPNMAYQTDQKDVS
jgi:hypothetical protein